MEGVLSLYELKPDEVDSPLKDYTSIDSHEAENDAKVDSSNVNKDAHQQPPIMELLGQYKASIVA